MKAILLYPLILLQLIGCGHGYYDDYFLANASLRLVPATLGSDVELRCFKILQDKLSYHNHPTADCTDITKDGCGHMWSKSNKTLGMAGNSSSTKYEFSARASYGYCDTFDDTKQRFESFNFKFDDTDYSQSNGFKCLVSIMTIKNITLDDLGVYVCNFSSHYNKFERYGMNPELDNVTVSLSATAKQPKEIIWAQVAYLGSDSDLVIQCIATGGNIKWMVFPQGYKGWGSCGTGATAYKYCSATKIPVDDLNTIDHWRSYNYSVVSGNPYEGVYESLFAARGTTFYDEDTIACIIEGTDEGTLKKITKFNNSYRPSNRDTVYDITLTAIICISILFPVLAFAFIFMAAVRSKSCVPGIGTNQDVIAFAVPIAPQTQPQIV